MNNTEKLTTILKALDDLIGAVKNEQNSIIEGTDNVVDKAKDIIVVQGIIDRLYSIGIDYKEEAYAWKHGVKFKHF